jgi:Base plate wedge protein 53
MQYFQTLPLITQTDPYGNSITTNNIITRAYFLPSLLNNLLLFYTYDLRPGDTPENIAYKYYSDIYSYWVVLYSNNIIDPQAQWPLDDQQFILYLNDKYASAANGVSNVLPYITSSVHHYEQYITTTNSNDNQGQTITIQIDGPTYNSFVNYSTTSSFSDGSTVTKTVSVAAISIFDYENNLNESKRNIKIMNKNYYPSVQSQFQNLMRT